MQRRRAVARYGAPFESLRAVSESEQSEIRTETPESILSMSRISSDEQVSLTIDIIGLSSLTGLSCRLHSRDSADSGSLGCNVLLLVRTG